DRLISTLSAIAGTSSRCCWWVSELCASGRTPVCELGQGPAIPVRCPIRAATWDCFARHVVHAVREEGDARGRAGTDHALHVCHLCGGKGEERRKDVTAEHLHPLRMMWPLPLHPIVPLGNR